MAIGTLYIGADKRVLLSTLLGDGAALTGATVTYALTDSVTATVVGSGSLTLTTGSTYAAVIDRAVTTTLVDGRKYWLDVVISSAGFDDERRVGVFAGYRGET